MRRLSLASRLGLLFAACAASVALIAGVLFNRASEAHFIELDRQLLQGNLPVFSDLLRTVHSRAELEAQQLQLEQELRRRPELALRVLGGDGQVWFSSLQQGSPSSDPHAEHWRNGDNDYRTSSVTLASGTRLDLLLDITHHQHFLEQMQRLIWLTVGLSALATALLGAWVARRGLAPLQRMTVAAQAISASSLTNRLQLGHAPRELADLIDAFNAMLARLEEAFARLSAFSADIAHELRTPLSNLLTQTQVILSQPREQADYREALHSNLEELQHLAQMVNDMLLLAKADNGLLPTRREPLQVGEELHLLAEYFAPLAEDAGVRLAVDGVATLDADRALLRRALSNLRGEISGRLTLATSHHIGLHRLPPLLRAFTRAHPQVALDIQFLDSEVAYEEILHGRAELAVIPLAPEPREPVRAVSVWDDPLDFVAAPEHPLVRMGPVTLADVALHPAVFPGDNTFTHHIVRRLFEGEGLTPNIGMSTNYLETIKMMVSIGLAWSVLPRTMLDEQVTRLALADIQLRRELGYIVHTERTLSNAAKAFMALLDEQRTGLAYAARTRLT